mmetsp:Transcript_18193/g.32980  ORF Transcript_18193/g.32980 Transcript_18193/m.32980 type:complete len:391 (-) Transcript_18193:156-1328(-)
MEILSNSRNVEVYVKDDSSDATVERYLFTSRGMQHDSGYYKILLMHPGGPGKLAQVHIKLLSLQPTPHSTSKTIASVSVLKFKGRLPDPMEIPITTTTTATTTANSEEPSSSSSTQENRNSKGASPGNPGGEENASSQISSADLGVAMGAVSMMVRSTEDRLTKTISTDMGRVESVLGERMVSLEKSVATLSTMVVQQQVKLQQQHEFIMNQQKAMLILQKKMMDTMTQNQFILMDQIKKSTQSMQQPHPQENQATQIKEIDTEGHDKTNNENQKKTVDSNQNDADQVAVVPVNDEAEIKELVVSEDGTPKQNAQSLFVGAAVSMDDSEIKEDIKVESFTDQTASADEDPIVQVLAMKKDDPTKSLPDPESFILKEGDLLGLMDDEEGEA